MLKLKRDGAKPTVFWDSECAKDAGERFLAASDGYSAGWTAEAEKVKPSGATVVWIFDRDGYRIGSL